MEGKIAYNLFSSYHYTYDLEANLLTLKRHGQTDVNSWGLVNDLAMTYEHGQLKTSVDHAEAALLESNLGDASERRDTYAYDHNGNLTMDTSRDITSITYNALNIRCLSYGWLVGVFFVIFLGSNDFFNKFVATPAVCSQRCVAAKASAEDSAGVQTAHKPQTNRLLNRHST